MSSSWQKTQLKSRFPADSGSVSRQGPHPTSTPSTARASTPKTAAANNAHAARRDWVAVQTSNNKRFKFHPVPVAASASPANPNNASRNNTATTPAAKTTPRAAASLATGAGTATRATAPAAARVAAPAAAPAATPAAASVAAPARLLATPAPTAAASAAAPTPVPVTPCCPEHAEWFAAPLAVHCRDCGAPASHGCFPAKGSGPDQPGHRLCPRDVMRVLTVLTNAVVALGEDLQAFETDVKVLFMDKGQFLLFCFLLLF